MEDSGQNLKSKNTLKTFFQKGDIPEEDQFADLIDAFRHMDDGHTITNVSTDLNGIISITLSNGTVVAITPPVTDEYVPKTGGDFTGRITAQQIFSNGHFEVNGDVVGNMNSKLREFSGAYFSFNGNAHGNSPLHALFSTNDPSVTGIGLVMNSVHNIRLNIDSNGNSDTAAFEVGSDSIGVTGSTLFSVNEIGETRSSGSIFENEQRVATQNWVNTQNDLKYVPKTGGGFTGQVGVGTDTPEALLEVKGTFSPTRPQFAVNTVDDIVSINLQHQGVSKGYMWYNAGFDTMGLGRGFSEGHTLFIDGNDNFGIGTSAPEQKLHINGGLVRIQSPSGHADIGSIDDTGFHFQTELSKFWFNKKVLANGNLGLAAKGTYMRFSDGAILENHQRVATQDWTNSQGFLKDTTATNFVRKDRDENNAFFNDYLIFNHNSTTDVDAISFNPSTNGFYFNADTGKSNTSANGNIYVSKVIAFNDIACADTIRSGGDIHTNVDIRGRTASGAPSKLMKFEGLYFNGTPTDSDIGTKKEHSIRSSYGDTSDKGSITLNSYNHIRLNIDSNNNSTNSRFEIGGATTGVENVLFSVNENGETRSSGAIFENNQRVATQSWVNTQGFLNAINWNIITGKPNLTGAVHKNSYWGLTLPDHTDTGWVRTTVNGIIPFKSGGASRLGTSSWPFNEIYTKVLYENGTTLSDKYLSKTGIAANSNLLDGKDSSAFLLKTGGTMTGDLTMTNRTIRWAENTDVASIGFKNDNDADTNSYMYFKTGDNNNEHFKWLHRASGSSLDAEWMSLRANGLVVSGNVTAYSDKRLKTALQPIKENILDKIDQLKPTFYQWKDQAKDQAKQLGFIAQEVKEVFPEWVHENDEYYSMSYDKMGAVLAVQGIQELRAEIKSLKEELKSLRDGFTK